MKKLETLQHFQKSLQERAGSSFLVKLQKNHVFYFEKCDGVANEMKALVLLTAGRDVDGKRIKVTIHSHKRIARSNHWYFTVIKFEIDWRTYREVINEQQR